MTETKTTLITGNTYPVKDQLRSMGGRWDASAKGWRVPASVADEARRLVSGETERRAKSPAKSKVTRDAGPGERAIYRTSRPYSVGDVVRVRGDDACLTVVHCWTIRHSEYSEDMGVYETQYHAICRASTDEEAAPYLAARDIEAARAEGARLGAAFRTAELDAAEVDAMGPIADDHGRPIVPAIYDAPEAGLVWAEVTVRRDGGRTTRVDVTHLSDGRRCVRRSSHAYDDHRVAYYVEPMAVAS
jgi:hypothetical protein